MAKRRMFRNPWRCAFDLNIPLVIKRPCRSVFMDTSEKTPTQTRSCWICLVMVFMPKFFCAEALELNNLLSVVNLCACKSGTKSMPASSAVMIYICLAVIWLCNLLTEREAGVH